jgi:hypothetical protein
MSDARPHQQSLGEEGLPSNPPVPPITAATESPATAASPFIGAAATAVQQSAAVAAYLRKHRVNVLVDRMVRDLLEERPANSGAWMLEWLAAEHAKRDRRLHASSSAAGSTGSATPAMSGGAAGGLIELPAGSPTPNFDAGATTSGGDIR